MMYALVKFHHKRSFHLWGTKLNMLGNHKPNFVQQSLKIRSRSENNTDIAEKMF